MTDLYKNIERFEKDNKKTRLNEYLKDLFYIIIILAVGYFATTTTKRINTLYAENSVLKTRIDSCLNSHPFDSCSEKLKDANTEIHLLKDTIDSLQKIISLQNSQAILFEEKAAYYGETIRIGLSENKDSLFLINNALLKNAVKIIYTTTLNPAQDILLSSKDLSIRQKELTIKNNKQKKPCIFFAAVANFPAVNLEKIKIIVVYGNGRMKVFDKNYR